MGTARRMDYTAIGDTVNVAARLTAEAAPDQILISAATWDSLREKVPARRLPPRKLKGRGEPIETFEIQWKEMRSASVDLKRRLRRPNPYFYRPDCFNAAGIRTSTYCCASWDRRPPD